MNQNKVEQPEQNPKKQAWITNFFIENHLDYFTYPEHAVSLEKVGFMVMTDEDDRYYPCSDRMYQAIIEKKEPWFIDEKYQEVLKRVLPIVSSQVSDKFEKKYLESLILIKYEHEIKDRLMIPSRLEKRLINIFLNRTQIEDPWLEEKKERNQYVSTLLNSPDFKKALNDFDPLKIKKLPRTLTGLKQIAEYLAFTRLVSLAVKNDLWESKKQHPLTRADYQKIFKQPPLTHELKQLLSFLDVSESGHSGSFTKPKKILWLANQAGEVIIDLTIISYLAQKGHKIIIAFKEGPVFTKINCADVRQDKNINEYLKNAFFIQNNNLSKNELINILRSDNHIFVLSDGTRENVNLLLSSTSFIRAFKEVDIIISRGRDQYRRFFDSHFQFTQDIFNISSDKNDNICISLKPRHPDAIKFSYEDLEKKAQAIIDQMKTAKKQGKTIIFYSGIIGSVPGRIDIAKKIMLVFIQSLKKELAMTFIINPSEYYEKGMDADDLMYMWEIVQQSGYIEIWRFQTYTDIVDSFKIMEQKVPPEWVGKDATFSTGCTKEMKIALEVQNKFPEMQIIGPARDKFMRREDYGMGKMHDQRLDNTHPSDSYTG